MVSTSSESRRIAVRITALSRPASNTLMLELREANGAMLPRFEAGSNIELIAAPGMSRNYSLLNNPAETHRYVIAIYRVPGGGHVSRLIHETLRAGAIIHVGSPRNNFPLSDARAHSVLIGGGIGITPLLSMIHSIQAQGKSWELWHAVRSRDLCAFQDQYNHWNSRHSKLAHVHVDEEAGCRLDIERLVSVAPAGTHFYACGPAPMLDEFLRATAAIPSSQVHLERFGISAPLARIPKTDTFHIVLSRSCSRHLVLPHQSVLDVLLDAGIDAPFSCGEGFCGSCRLSVLGGTPNHRDSVLTAVEKSSGKVMMACVSRSLTPELILDI